VDSLTTRTARGEGFAAAVRESDVKGMCVKRHVMTLAVAGLALGACSKKGAPTLATVADSASYAIGMNWGSTLIDVRDHMDLALIMRGLQDGASNQALLSDADARRIVRTFALQLDEVMKRRQDEQSETNARAGASYRAENGKRPGVQTTASGLQYEVLTKGDGPTPARTDRVTVHYRGTLVDGKEFDSSHGDEPVTFALDRVIPGWTEGVQLMTVGSKYRFVLPPELAYGERGSPPDIGPNATLIFEVELLGIEQ